MTSSPTATQEIINDETKRLRLHLGLGESPGMPSSSTPPVTVPLFFIERGPDSRNGAKCRLPSCSDRIEPRQYRVALNPGMGGPGRVQSSQNSDFYHVACFEKIADLSQPNFLDRIQPVTRKTFPLRNLKGRNILDGDYFCDGGAERLILEWKTQRGKWIDKRNGVEQEPLNPAFDNILRRAGSSTFESEGSVPNLSTHEYILLLTRLAPFESDGLEDSQEWNLFDSYLNADDNEESLSDRHNLSNMLKRWDDDVGLVMCDDEDLTDTERQAKAQLSEKAVRALERLGGVPMPDFQGAFLGQGL